MLQYQGYDSHPSTMHPGSLQGHGAKARADAQGAALSSISLNETQSEPVITEIQ
jgi:hypothetical protein